MNTAIALAVMLALSGLFVLAHRWLHHFHLRTNATTREALIDSIDALLPQTQCGRCTFTGCRPYATALARGEADINQCPPGGRATATSLAKLLQRPAKEVDPRFGVMPAQPLVAVIDEAACIGCTKCIQACPVDAIVGAARYMHTVIADHCTGCELCIPPCPVDCIDMQPAPQSITASIRQTV